MSSTPNLHSLNPYVLRNRLYLKEFFGRPMVLTCAILYGISIALYLIRTIINGAAMIPTLVDMFNNLEANASDVYSSSYSVSFSFSTIINCIIFMIAFILMYSKAKNKSPDVAPTAGVTMFWVMSIIGLVASIFCAVLLVLCTLFLVLVIILIATGSVPLDGSADALMYEFTSLSSPNNAYISADTTTAIAIILFVVIAVIFAIMTAYILFSGIVQLRFASSMRKSLNTPNLERKGAVGFAVLCILSAISGVFSILGYIIYLIAIPFIPQASVTGFASPATAIPVLICDIVLMINSTILSVVLARFALAYNKHIKLAGINGEKLPMPIVVSAPQESSPQDLHSENVYADIVAPAVTETATLYQDIAPAPSEDASAQETPEQTSCIALSTDTAEPDNPYADSAPLSMQDINPEAKEIVDSVLTSVSMGEGKQTDESAPSAPAEQVASDAVNFCSACGKPVTSDALFCSKCGNKLH